MEFKGTKGQWIFKTSTDKFDSYTVCKGKIIGYAGNNKPVDVANEKLRAAAPELLEALKVFIDYCYGTELQESERFKKGKEAIEKALK